MKKLIFATGNENKMKEIRMILADCGYEILSMKEAGIKADIVEEGLEEGDYPMIMGSPGSTSRYLTVSEVKERMEAQNQPRITIRGARLAVLKEVMAASDKTRIQYANKYAGSSNYWKNSIGMNKAIIDKLAGVPDEKRTARFVCAIAAAFPDGKTITRRGTIEGIIGYEERGENGFGYDPIFFLPEYGKSTAELSPEEKNTISHRGNALRLIKEVINENTDN